MEDGLCSLPDLAGLDYEVARLCIYMTGPSEVGTVSRHSVSRCSTATFHALKGPILLFYSVPWQWVFHRRSLSYKMVLAPKTYQVGHTRLTGSSRTALTDALLCTVPRERLRFRRFYPIWL